MIRQATGVRGVGFQALEAELHAGGTLCGHFRRSLLVLKLPCSPNICKFWWRLGSRLNEHGKRGRPVLPLVMHRQHAPKWLNAGGEKAILLDCQYPVCRHRCFWPQQNSCILSIVPRVWTSPAVDHSTSAIRNPMPIFTVALRSSTLLVAYASECAEHAAR